MALPPLAAMIPSKRRQDHHSTLPEDPKSLPHINHSNPTPAAYNSRLFAKFTTAEAIAFHMQLSYDEELELTKGVRAFLLDSNIASLQRIQNASHFSSDFHDCAPIPSNSAVWTQFAPIADCIVTLAISPSKFIEDLPDLACRQLVNISSNEDAERREKTQEYYSRILNVNAEQYSDLLEEYGRAYPNDLSFVVIQLQYLGFGERASQLFKSIMKQLGYPEVQLKVDDAIEGTHQTLRPAYSGTTINTPEERDEQDRNAQSTSRMVNFLKVCGKVPWIIFRWPTLQRPIKDKKDWRKEEDLGQIEANLIDCIVPNFNKARGGWVHSIQLHPSIASPLKAMTDMLPRRRESDPVPSELTEDLRQMVNEEVAAMKRLQQAQDLGGLYGDPAIEHLQKEFVERIRCINGAVTSVNLLDDLPREVGYGRIESSWSSNEAGRSVALYQRILKAIDGLETGDDNGYETILSFSGPFLDFWRILVLHKWWGLLALLTGFYLRRTCPYVVHTWSAQISQLLRSQILITLPPEVNFDPSLQGRDAMAVITPAILEEPRIIQTMNAPKDRDLRSHVGRTNRFIYGPGPLEFGISMTIGHIGSASYRATYFRHDKRRFTLVHALSVALNRLVDHFAATLKTPTTQDEKIEFLDIVEAEFERIAEASGVRDALDRELWRQHICDQAQGALLGKNAQDRATVETVADEERPRKRKKLERDYDRNNGMLARGEPRSVAREQQLQEMKTFDSLARKLGLEAPFLGPDGQRPNSQEYSDWFLDLRAGLSVSQSLNAHGRTLEGREGHLENGRKLAEFNKEMAMQTREQKEAAMDGWNWGEQFDQLVDMVPSLRPDLTAQRFQDSPRLAICPTVTCGNVAVGQDRNTGHRCTKTAEPVKIVKESFSSYIRVLYPHDILTYGALNVKVREQVAARCGLIASPALEWLEATPFPIDQDRLASVTGLVFWDVSKGKNTRMNQLMAADVALLELCAGVDPLDMAERNGKTVKAGARTRYNADQEKVWKAEYLDRIANMIQTSESRRCIFTNSVCAKAAAWDPCHRNILATGGRDGDVLIWDVRVRTAWDDDVVHPALTLHQPHNLVGWTRPASERHPSPSNTVTSILFLPFAPSRYLVTAGSSDGILKKWDLRILEHVQDEDTLTDTMKDPTLVYSRRARGISHIEYGEATNSIYAISVAGLVHRYETATMSALPALFRASQSPQMFKFEAKLAASPDSGAWLAATIPQGPSDGRVYLYSDEVSCPVVLNANDGRIIAVAWSGHDSLMTCSNAGVLRMWRADYLQLDAKGRELGDSWLHQEL